VRWLANAILNVPTNPPISWDVRINKNHVDLIAGRSPTGNLGGLVEVTRFDKVVLCDELKFHIVNLHNYYGTWIAYPSNESARRIVLSDDNWEVTIDGVENLTELLDGLDREGGYAITHVGVLRQKGKRPFRVEEALGQMKQLGFFLTFVEGRWCTPMLLVGTRKGEIVFRDLSANARIDRWVGNWRWCPLEAKYLDVAYKGFVSKWNDRNWRETIAIILEFYARANTYPTVELSVLDSFTALDRLASAYSLEDVNPASKRIYQTLAKGGLDAQSPPKELFTFYDDFYKKNCPAKTADCATILADFRHGVVHGNRAIKQGDKWNRPNLANGDPSNPPLPFSLMIAAMGLGLWCLEMSILYLLKYNGQFNDRLTRAQEVPIKWSKPLA
jgi:hypothetical protein